jgi:putative transposase
VATRGLDPADIEPGKPWQNGVAASFSGTFRAECLKVAWCLSRRDARGMIERYRRQCNEERLHSSLAYRTPAEAETSRESLPEPDDAEFLHKS